MSVELLKGIEIVEAIKKPNTKATERYVRVKFTYKDTQTIWDGYVPIEYRRTGTNIDFNDKDALHTHLNYIYIAMDPKNLSDWNKEQEQFWKTKPKASVTKEFFDTLAKGGWKCGACDMPRNPNPQRRIQDLKEYGYTIATDLSRFCPKCKRNTSQRILLPIPRVGSQGNGYETWSQELRKKIIKVLGGIDVYEGTSSVHLLPDHKFSEIRWDENTKVENPDTMTPEEIKAKFQLLTNQRNQQKREVCRNCFQTGKRGTIYGISYFYEGDENWDISIPIKGKEAEKGCIGCPWYDIQKWREHLTLLIKEKTKK